MLIIVLISVSVPKDCIQCIEGFGYALSYGLCAADLPSLGAFTCVAKYMYDNPTNGTTYIDSCGKCICDEIAGITSLPTIVQEAFKVFCKDI